jgi:hypothetical protein
MQSHIQLLHARAKELEKKGHFGLAQKCLLEAVRLQGNTSVNATKAAGLLIKEGLFEKCVSLCY